MKVVYVYADHPGEGSCSDWLCRFPAKALYNAGHNVAVIHISQFVEKPPDDADIVVVERVLWNGVDPVKFDRMQDGPTKSGVLYWANMKVLDTIDTCQSKGVKVIAVFDDHYEAYPDTHAKFRDRWLYGVFDGVGIGFIPIDHFEIGLGMVDAVMTPSKYLSEYYGSWAKRMYTIHNRPNLSMFPVLQNEPFPRKLTIGWAGTSQHEVSWRDSNILDVLSQIGDRIILIGYFPKSIARMLDKRGIEYQQGKWVDYEHFPRVVAAYDIGICPLAGEFDKGRSWIKWLECSLMGKPVVAQDHAGVYDGCYGGFLADTDEQWVKSIAALTDPEVYRQMSFNGISWAWRQGWDSNLSEITDIFDEVLSS